MKTAIIIGATSGLGREAAARLVTEGWKVGIAGRRTAALEAFQKEFGKDKVCIATMDVTRPESVEALDDLLSQTGDPNLFFYVSGVGYQNRELDEEIEMCTLQTNCEGMVRMVDHFFHYSIQNAFSFYLLLRFLPESTSATSGDYTALPILMLSAYTIAESIKDFATSKDE